MNCLLVMKIKWSLDINTGVVERSEAARARRLTGATVALKMYSIHAHKGSHSCLEGVTYALGANDRGVTVAWESFVPLTPAPRLCLCRPAVAVAHLRIYMPGWVANRARPALKPFRRLQQFIIGPAGFIAGRPALKRAGRLSSGPGLQSDLNIYIAT